MKNRFKDWDVYRISEKNNKYTEKEWGLSKYISEYEDITKNISLTKTSEWFDSKFMICFMRISW